MPQVTAVSNRLATAKAFCPSGNSVNQTGPQIRDYDLRERETVSDGVIFFSQDCPHSPAILLSDWR